MTHCPSEQADSLETPRPRRHFLVRAAALVVAGLTVTVPSLIAAAYAMSPLCKRSKSTSGDDSFRFVGKTGGLTPGGAPQLFQVIGAKKDGWTTYPGIALGSVLVGLDQDGKLTCLNARCPHLGCTVGYQAAQKKLFCPCHAAAFALDGVRTNETPPRDLDRLEAEIRNKDEIWVRFQNFRSGTEQKIPV